MTCDFGLGGKGRQQRNYSYNYNADPCGMIDKSQAIEILPEVDLFLEDGTLIG
jgi:hypothetical protein